MAIRQQALGEEHASTLLSRHQVAHALALQEKNAAAEPFMRRAYEQRKRVLGAANAATLSSHGYLASIVAEQGRLDEAQAMFAEVLAIRRRVLPPDSTALASTLASAGNNLVALQAFADAETLLRECLEIRQAKLPGKWQMFNAMSLLGRALSGQGRYEDAEPLLVEGYEGIDPSSAPAAELRSREALRYLIQHYEAWGKPEEAANWRARQKDGRP